MHRCKRGQRHGLLLLSVWFVTGCARGDLKVWEAHISLLHAEKDAHRSHLLQHCTPDHNGCCVEFRLASRGQDSKLKIWIVSQHEGAEALGAVVQKYIPRHCFCTVIDVAPQVCDCFCSHIPWIATGSVDRSVNEWRIGDGDDRTASESKETQCQGRKLPGHFGLLLADWSEEDVRTWLCDEGLEELVGVFKANNTDGPELSQLNKETAAELGTESVGLRGRLLRNIKALKPEQSVSEVPDEFLCPVTRELMKDPVTAADGYSYERESIESWIGGKNKTSPVTNLPLQTTLLTPRQVSEDNTNLETAARCGSTSHGKC